MDLYIHGRVGQRQGGGWWWRWGVGRGWWRWEKDCVNFITILLHTLFFIDHDGKNDVKPEIQDQQRVTEREGDKDRHTNGRTETNTDRQTDQHVQTDRQTDQHVQTERHI